MSWRTRLSDHNPNGTPPKIIEPKVLQDTEDDVQVVEKVSSAPRQNKNTFPNTSQQPGKDQVGTEQGLQPNSCHTTCQAIESEAAPKSKAAAKAKAAPKAEAAQKCKVTGTAPQALFNRH